MTPNRASSRAHGRAIATRFRSTARTCGPIRPRAFSPKARTVLRDRRSGRVSLAGGALGWTSRARADDLRAARRDLHAARARSPRRRERLADLRDLGVTAIELMPVAEFPGAATGATTAWISSRRRGSYGGPDDLRRFVDAAHRLGLARDPRRRLQPSRPRRQLPVGVQPALLHRPASDAVGRRDQLRRPGRADVRRVLRRERPALDARVPRRRPAARRDARADRRRPPATFSPSSRDARARRARSATSCVIAEDDRNLAALVAPAAAAAGPRRRLGRRLPSRVRRCWPATRDGYYADYTGTIGRRRRTIRQGWFVSPASIRRTRRSRAAPIRRRARCLAVRRLPPEPRSGRQPARSAIACTTRSMPPRSAPLGAAAARCPRRRCCSWVRSGPRRSPFQFFTDHEPGLGTLVTEGRRREFRTSRNSPTRMPGSGYPIRRARRRSSGAAWIGPSGSVPATRIRSRFTPTCFVCATAIARSQVRRPLRWRSAPWTMRRSSCIARRTARHSWWS